MNAILDKMAEFLAVRFEYLDTRQARARCYADVCFQLLKYRGTENRAAGLPAGVGWAPWQGTNERTKGGAIDGWAIGRARAGAVRACVLRCFITVIILR